MKDILSKLKSVELCLSAHPDNEPNSEFADRITDLIEISKQIKLKIMTKKQIKKLANDLMKYKDEFVSSYTTNDFFETQVTHKEIINVIYSHIALTLIIIDEEENQIHRQTS